MGRVIAGLIEYGELYGNDLKTIIDAQPVSVASQSFLSRKLRSELRNPELPLSKRLLCVDELAKFFDREIVNFKIYDNVFVSILFKHSVIDREKIKEKLKFLEWKVVTDNNKMITIENVNKFLQVVRGVDQNVNDIEKSEQANLKL